MTDEVNFSTNWNNKLTATFFTTLRLKDERRWVIGTTKRILLNRKPLFDADIIAVKHFRLNDINDFVAGLDTGYSAEQCKQMIRTMYKKQNIDWSQRMLSLVLFRRIKNTSVKSIQLQMQESA